MLDNMVSDTVLGVGRDRGVISVSRSRTTWCLTPVWEGAAWVVMALLDKSTRFLPQSAPLGSQAESGAFTRYSQAQSSSFSLLRSRRTLQHRTLVARFDSRRPGIM
jgi:hypothetical protein